MHAGQHRRYKTIDAPQQVVIRDALIEPELIEETPLITPPRPIVRRLLGGHPRLQRNYYSPIFSTFFDRIGEIALELTGHGLPLSKCEAYNRVYDQPYELN